jgi:xanthine dehydrogenase accessory factor
MDNIWGTDRDVIQHALEWLQEGHSPVLVTVLKTWGSSPRPPGSLMVMRTDGVHAGSVSGGCVEEDLLARHRQGELSEQLPTRLNYGVDRQEATRFGLPCGGRLELLLEDLRDPESLRALLSGMERGELINREVDLTSGKVILSPATADQEFSSTDNFVSKVFGPRWQMLLIGAGHLSRYVSQLALMLDYRVIVCDPREEYAAGWQLPGTQLISAMPDDAVLEHAQHERSIVLALTHDPKLDDMALLDALNSKAFYIGAIGSQRNCQSRRQRLQQLGLTEEKISRLHAPVGLDIGSHTPPEIAVAILAEITARRNSAMSVVRNSTTASVA